NLMPYVPKNHVNISTGFTIYKLNFNIALSYFDFSYTQTGVNQTTQAQIIPSYYLIDASLHYNLTHQFRVFVTANNVTNNVYLVSRHPMGLRPGMPRSLQIGLKWDLN